MKNFFIYISQVFFLCSVVGNGLCQNTDELFIVVIKPNPNKLIEKNIKNICSDLELASIKKIEILPFIITVSPIDSQILDLKVSTIDDSLVMTKVTEKILDIFRKDLKISIKVLGNVNERPDELKRLFYLTPKKWNWRKIMKH